MVLHEGEEPYLSPEILESTDPIIKAILEARKPAMAYDENERPSAREISNILVEAAARLGVMEEPSPRKKKAVRTIDREREENGNDGSSSNEGKDVVSLGQTVPSSPQNERGLHKLELVHIAKCGGTSIEYAGE